MSYKDLRSFTELMRALGYPRLISYENFRFCNFPLVAEILKWLVTRYDVNVELPFDIDTENERVLFIKSIAQFMATKGHIKLNTKKLYMADGHAVKELLKIASLLYEAMKSKTDIDVESIADEETMDFSFDISAKLRDLKVTRQIASEITVRGASLYDLIAKEMDMREVRTSALMKQLDVSEIEQNLRKTTKNIEEDVKKTKGLIENIAADEENLETKIEKRKVDLERSQKRLETLKSVRPAFMDEYERLEEELEQLYDQYVTKFLWLAYLEQQLEELEKVEQEIILQKEEIARKMVEKLRQDDMLRMEENNAFDDYMTPEEDNNKSTAPVPPPSSDIREKPRRPQPTASGTRRETKRRVFGSMSGGERDDSLDTDSDLELDDDDDASDVSEDDNELGKLTDKKIAPAPTVAFPQSDDDDF